MKSEVQENKSEVYEVKRVLNVDGLGLCGQCNTLVTYEDYPPGVMDDNWVCPNRECRKRLTYVDFGRPTHRSEKRMQWVGPGKIWMDERPLAEFEIDGVHITLDPLPS